MSKWIDNYTAHQFHGTWTDFKKRVDNIDTSVIVEQNVLFEIARLKKVIIFIDSYLSLVDPEINQVNILDTPLLHLKQADVQLNAYIENNNDGHLINVNTYIDNCLTAIKNMQIQLPKISAKSVTSMLTTYNKIITSNLHSINLSQVKQNSDEIRELTKYLISGENSIKVQIDELLQNASEKHLKINQYYNEMLIDKDGIPSTKTELFEAKTEILVDIKNLKSSMSEIAEKIRELDDFYGKIYGVVENTEEPSENVGLKKEFDLLFGNVQKFESLQKNKYKTLIEQIESLLPAATSVGLAEAYHNERKKFIIPIKIWNGVFIGALMLMSGLSFFSLRAVQSITDIGDILMHSLPVSLPLIWLAIFASKRRSESKRLEQEYVHKETLARSYSGYKQQIEQLSQPDKELLIKLLEAAIDSISYNASKTLDKKHGDEPFIQSLLSRATPSFKSNNDK
nr:hypothetical protein [uncultured bacterium]